jgi:hypothetical protein
MTDEERWVNLEGEPPAWIARLLDAAREAPRRTPEAEARMARAYHEALAAEGRKRARRRVAVTAGIATAGLLAAGVAVTLAKGELVRDAAKAAGGMVVEERAAGVVGAVHAAAPGSAEAQAPARPRGTAGQGTAVPR